MQEEKHVSEVALTHFTHYFSQLLIGLGEMFPENQSILTKKLKFDLGITNMFDKELKQKHMLRLITEFQDQISPHYKLIHSKSDEFFEAEIPILVDISPLWDNLDPDNRATVWQYLEILMQHATCYNMYSKIPEGLRGTISKVTNQLEETSKRGEKVDLASMSGQILNGADPEEMKNFAMGMMENKDQLENIFRIASSQLQKMQKDT